jgi:hypothetical protein
VQAARRIAGFGGLEHLYDRHYAAFGYPADQLKCATVAGLRDSASWQSSLDALMRGIESDLEDIEWQRWLALLLELLARINDALLVRRLKDRIRGALTVSPSNVALHLAMGFIGIAEHDDAATRTSFLTALLLAQQPELKERCDPSELKERCDPWSLAFAQACLLDHSDVGTSRLILPIDPVKLASTRAAALLSHGAIMPALNEYGSAVSPLLVQRLPHNYSIFNGYKIVFFKNQFYAVPKNVRDFSILRGRVISIPDADEGSGSSVVRARFAALLSDWQRARLKYLLRVARPHLRFTARALRAAIRALRRLAGDIYLRMHIVGGVLIDRDAAQLEQRIDAPKQASWTLRRARVRRQPDRSDR